jgi:excisionase family DNA binding protein
MSANELDIAPRLLRVREVAERMSASRATVYRRISAGELLAVKIGRGPSAHLRVPEDALERFIYHPKGPHSA